MTQGWSEGPCPGRRTPGALPERSRRHTRRQALSAQASHVSSRSCRACQKRGGHEVKGQRLAGGPEFDRSTRHAEDGTTLLALCDRVPPARAYRAQALGPVPAHTRQKCRQRRRIEPRSAPEQDVDRRAVPRNQRPLDQPAPQRSGRGDDHVMRVAGGDQNQTGLDRIPVARDPDPRQGRSLQAFDHAVQIGPPDVLDRQNGRAVFGKSRQDSVQRFDASGGGAEQDDRTGCGCRDAVGLGRGSASGGSAGARRACSCRYDRHLASASRPGPNAIGCPGGVLCVERPRRHRGTCGRDHCDNAVGKRHELTSLGRAGSPLPRVPSGMRERRGRKRVWPRNPPTRLDRRTAHIRCQRRRPLPSGHRRGAGRLPGAVTSLLWRGRWP